MMLLDQNWIPENSKKTPEKQSWNILKLAQTTVLTVGLLLINWWFAQAENNWLNIKDETTSTENDKKIQIIKYKLSLIESINLTEKQKTLIQSVILNHEMHKELWNIPDFYKITIKKVQIKSLSDYSQILDEYEYLQDLPVNKMNLDNFVNIIDSLFDISSPYKISRTDNWVELTTDELVEYKQKLLVQSMYIKRTILDYDDKTKLKFLNEWFKLFNDWVSRSISKSRSAQRLIAFSSFSILTNKYPTKEMVNIKKEEMVNMLNYIVTQAWRYEILTSNWATSGLQITVEIAGITNHFFIVWWESLNKYHLPLDIYLKLINNYIHGVDNMMRELKDIYKNKKKLTKV